MTDMTMFERIARAICCGSKFCGAEDGNTKCRASENTDEVRAVLAEVREPSDTMMAAGWIAINDHDLRYLWQAMIDEASK